MSLKEARGGAHGGQSAEGPERQGPRGSRPPWPRRCALRGAVAEGGAGRLRGRERPTPATLAGAPAGVGGWGLTGPTDVDVHAAGIDLSLGWRRGHGRHAQVRSVQVLLGPLPVVCLVVQVGKNHRLLELSWGGAESHTLRWAQELHNPPGRPGPAGLTRNFLVSRPSSPHSFWLSSMRAPSEAFFRGLGGGGRQD